MLILLCKRSHKILRLQINSNSSSSNPLSLNTIFKQVENAVVRITNKIPPTGAPTL
ncbi:MAG: hypothetical protein WCC17_12155 [Candidatus Nitrosopolaris sp.]